MAAKKQKAKTAESIPEKKGTTMQDKIQAAQRDLDEDEQKIMDELEREQKELDKQIAAGNSSTLPPATGTGKQKLKHGSRPKPKLDKPPVKKKLGNKPKLSGFDADEIKAARLRQAKKDKSSIAKELDAHKDAPADLVKGRKAAKEALDLKRRQAKTAAEKAYGKPGISTRNVPGPDVVVWVDPNSLEIEEGFNPRFDMGDMQGMVHSVGSRGVRQTIIVQARLLSKDGKTKLRSPRYVVRSGHRRVAAAVRALEKGYERCRKVPVLVRKYQNDDEAYADALILNDHKSLNPVEMCAALTRLKEAGHGIKEISELTGKRQTWVRITLSLSQAGEKLTEALVKGEISVRDSTDIIKSAGDDIELQDRAVTRRGFLKKKHKLTKRPIDDDSKTMQPALMRRQLSDLATAYSRFMRGRGPAKSYNEDWEELEDQLKKIRKAKSAGRLVV